MFFSVIVPVYKVEKFLIPCIESVISQTFSDFELILVDDGSPDNCPKICDDYAKKDSRIKVIHKENGGLASARKKGIEFATGDYVLNLDSDDKIELYTLECAYKIIQKTNCDIISFSYKWVDEEGKTFDITTDVNKEGLYDREKIEKEIFPRIMMDENMNHISYYLAGKVIKTTLLKPIQLRVNSKISLGEDLCCTVPCYLDAQSIYISKKETYLYTKRNDSISKEFNANQVFQIDDVIDEVNKLNFEKVSDIDSQIYRYSFFMCFAILASAAEKGHFKSIKTIKNNILKSNHISRIKKAEFKHISIKSRIGLILMKRNFITLNFYFLYVCELIKKFLRKG